MKKRSHSNGIGDRKYRRPLNEEQLKRQEEQLKRREEAEVPPPEEPTGKVNGNNDGFERGRITFCQLLRMMILKMTPGIMLIILVFWTTKICCHQELAVFTTGMAGSGKSTLMYGLLNIDEEEINKKIWSPAVTLMADNITRNSVYVSMYEWRSLEHDESEVGKETVLQIQSTDLVLYTIRMDDVRCRPAHRTGLRKLGRHFGLDIWKKSVIALTFANRVGALNKHGRLESNEELLNEKKENWIGCIHEVLLEESLPRDVVDEIPIVPAGYYKRPTMFDKSWVNTLIGRMYSRMTDVDDQKNFRLVFGDGSN